MQEQQNTVLETNSQPPLRSASPWTAKSVGAVIALVVLSFVSGFGLGHNDFKVSNGKIEITKGPDKSADYSLLWNALDLLNTKYVDRGNLDQKKLLYGAVKGMMAAAGDPYTVFFDPDESKDFSDELKGSFEGIGAQIDTKDDQIIVVAPLADSPAEKAGLLPGDIVLAIDHESTAGLNVDAAVAKIRGAAGTKVTLSVLHKDQKQPQDVTITRDKITVNSVKLDTKEVNGKKIAVIKVSRFGDDTVGLFQHDVDVVLSSGYQGIILDLRSNPGGYLDAAVDLASNWVDNGNVVVKEVNYQGQVKDYNASGLPRLKGVKTVVLVNGGSASASEILSGALQDYKLATLVGEKTFGKGSVQELSDLADNTSLKITVAKWHTPNDRSIDKNGLEPDVNVPLSGDDYKAGKDPQMDKALDLLK
jgi:carboxyl-terminal processing protease